METLPEADLATAGLIIFAFLAFAAVAVFLISAGSLKLCISMLGNAKPSFINCAGLLFGITAINSFIVMTSWAVVGEAGSLIVTPITWVVTLYMVSKAADCGWGRAFGIWIANSFLTTIGLFGVFLLLLIPMALLGASMEDTFGNLAAQMSGEDFDEFDLEADGFPPTTNVQYGAYDEQTAESDGPPQAFANEFFFSEEESSDEPTTPETNAFLTDSPELNEEEQASSGSDEFRTSGSGEVKKSETKYIFDPENQRIPKVVDTSDSPGRESETSPEGTFGPPKAPRGRPAPAKARRAADGSMLNPFFDQ